MLNNLTQHERCVIVTTDGDSVAGSYAGIETPHGDWSVLVATDRGTLSIPVGSIASAHAA